MKNHPIVSEVTIPISSPNEKIVVSYNHKPKIQTKTELDRLRKKTNFEEIEASVNFNSLNLSQRVEEREKQHSSYNRTTIEPNRLIKARKVEDVTKFEKLFSKRPIGIHGNELPKFSENCKDYWKLKEGYIESPNTSVRYHPDTRPVSEHSSLRSRSSAREIPLKPNENNPFPNFEISKEIKIVEKRPYSRPRFTDDFFYSNSARSSQEKNITIIHTTENHKSSTYSRPNSTGLIPPKKHKERPSTAVSGKNKTNEKILIRSQGFTITNL